MDVCQVASIGLDSIAGMGEISAANRATDYASLSGLEPELFTDKPAWVIQFQGSVPQPLERETWIDPVCVEIDGHGGLYATGPVIMESGKLWTPAPIANPPSLSLPPLAP